MSISLPLKKLKIIGALVGLALLGLLAGWLIATYLPRTVDVPQTIKQQAGFPLLVPAALPGNYSVGKDSFTFIDGVVVFHARDGAASITFAGQKRPAEFDFERFYQTQMKEAKTLSNVPYSSVVGKSLDDQTQLLSVTTDTTWLLVSTRAALTQNDLEVIAKGLRQTN